MSASVADMNQSINYDELEAFVSNEEQSNEKLPLAASSSASCVSQVQQLRLSMSQAPTTTTTTNENSSNQTTTSDSKSILTVKTSKDLKKCTSTIQDFVLVQLNQAIAEKLSSSVSILRQDYIGTLTRCLDTLERIRDEDESGASAGKALQEVSFHPNRKDLQSSCIQRSSNPHTKSI